MGVEFATTRHARGGDVGPVRQRTLKTAIGCSGVGLHSGDKISMMLKPAAADSGIRFVRTDLQGAGAVIPARWDKVVDTRLCTMIGETGGATVGTVEHLMAALAGCGIDNVEVEINGGEVPIMDGSSAPFVFLIECAGVVEQEAPRRVIRVLKRVEVADGQSRASLAPGRCLTLDVEIDFESGVIEHQNIRLPMVNGSFCKELARARTFGFLHEVEQLWKMGLARGGSLENAVVVSGDKVLNEDGLRFEDEFVRHKVLDAVGDLYLAGAPLLGAFEGVRCGHAINNRLLRALFADPTAWTWDIVEGEEAEIAADGGIRSEPLAAIA
jgi:UDP-3-O-[3-hydroxymyristoyl] N-acetylglucosamine deacetylase